MPTADGKGHEQQPYKYSEKEYDTMMGMNMYDFHARQYDPPTIRFRSPDPMTEIAYSWSPYVYVKNNPLRYIDPTGMREWPVNSTYNGYNQVEITSGYRTSSRPNHNGVDINYTGAGNADRGVPILATHEGTVTRLATIEDDKNAGGNRVQITSVHGEVATYYMHLDQITEGLEVGSWVFEGDQIGTMGRSGKGSSTEYASHLHYELKIDGQSANPATSSTSLVDPQTLIRKAVLPEVTVTAQSTINSTPAVTVPEIRTHEIRTNR